MLLQKGLAFQERDFFKEPLAESEIRGLAAEVGVPALFARRSPSLKQMGLADQELSTEEMLSLMQREPRLIRRPIVRIGQRVLVGASPSALSSALESAG